MYTEKSRNVDEKFSTSLLPVCHTSRKTGEYTRMYDSPSMPRIVERQTHRRNSVAESVFDYSVLQKQCGHHIS